MFLCTLSQEKLIWFDYQEGIWKWELDKILAMQITDNVVDMMTDHIKKLPLHAQTIVSLAAVMGNQFDLKLLSLITSKHPHDHTHHHHIHHIHQQQQNEEPCGDSHNNTPIQGMEVENSLFNTTPNNPPNAEIASPVRLLMSDTMSGLANAIDNGLVLQLGEDYKWMGQDIADVRLQFSHLPCCQYIHVHLNDILLYSTPIYRPTRYNFNFSTTVYNKLPIIYSRKRYERRYILILDSYYYTIPPKNK